MVELELSQAPTLSFATTNVGSTSSNSPQTISVQNIGNTALDFTAITFPADFPEASGETTDCLTANILNAGGICTLPIDFMPTTGGLSPGTLLSETVGLTDNALNAIPGATQSVSVQGTAVQSVTVPNLVGQMQSAVAGLLSPSLDLGTVTMLTSSTVPIGEVISQNPGAGTLAQVGSSVSVVISSGVVVPSVVGLAEGTTQAGGTAEGSIFGAGLTVGTVTTQYSDTVPSGTVISESPDPGTAVNGGSSVNLVVSSGVPPAADQLTLENNYFVTGDYASAGITLHGAASGPITIPDLTTCECGQGVPDGADIIDGFLYWTTVETSTSPSGNTGTFLGYHITGQQIGSDITGYTDGTYSGTLRVYRADVNTFFQDPPTWNGARLGSGTFTVTLPNSGGGTHHRGRKPRGDLSRVVPEFPTQVRSHLRRFGRTHFDHRPHTSGRAGIL